MDDLRIGSWVVAPSLNSISSGGKTVRLEPKVMALAGCVRRAVARLPQLQIAVHPGAVSVCCSALSSRTGLQPAPCRR
jgi:hypothetical protein